MFSMVDLSLPWASSCTLAVHPLKAKNWLPPLPDLRLLSAFLPQHVSQCARQVRPHPVPVFVDLVAVRFETHLFQVLDQFLALRVHQQPYLPRGRFQLPVRQVDSLPHARICLRHSVFHLHSRLRREVFADHVVIRGPCCLLLVPRCVPVDPHPPPPLPAPLPQNLPPPPSRSPLRPVRFLQNQRAHRIDVEVQRPP